MFITLEGGEGSGKSTLAKMLAERLEHSGRAVTRTEEPTGTALGREVWRLFSLTPNSSPTARERGATISPMGELLLFEAARAQHVAEVVRPALERGDIVVCDRFADSSIAYQGYGRELGEELVSRLNDVATGGLEPDLTLLLDVPIEAGLVRAREANDGGKAADAIGEESLAFHRRVREGFLAIARRESGRVAVIDATRPLGEVMDEVWEVVSERMG